MKTAFAAIALALLPAALGQTDPGPSPTNSVGCEPHGDHWHCDGPATETGSAATITSSAILTTSHDEEDHTATEDPGPSPTESVGCEPHGDHWHCDGPAETTTLPDVTVSEDPGPSPTESVGCEPHGDHWHCDGPRETASLSEDPGPSPTASVGCEPHGDHWHCDGPAETGAEPTSTDPAVPDNGASSNSRGLAMVAGLAALAISTFFSI